MKKKLLNYILVSGMMLAMGCGKLDLNPLSDGSSETWNSTADEIEMSLNGFYKLVFWPEDLDDWTDDWIYRDVTTEITGATLNGESGFVKDRWTNAYKCIARTNSVIQSVERAADVLSQEDIDRYTAEARFVRAAQYSYLLAHYGNIVYTDRVLDIEEALALEQSDPASVLEKIYEDFDYAAEWLKAEFGSGELKRPSKGAAYAMKARIAAYMGDWPVARDAAKACMDLGIYTLHPDFGDLFLSSTKNSPETVFGFPRSIALNVVKGDAQNYVTRNAGGWGAKAPSWDLLTAFLCTDGKPIDESDVFNPREPFVNRDPRCAATIVPFGAEHLGYIYDPHPDAETVLQLASGQQVENRDTRSVAEYASFNGLVWKKGIDGDWLLNSWRTEPDRIIMRFADVLLLYAEAKIELNEIDESVVDAINQVRARAYGVAPAAKADYPAVAMADQASLRKTLRIERRMEFALEGIRYMDIIRWQLAEKVLNKPNYGLLDPADLREKVTSKGLWFFPETPEIDEDGVADFSSLAAAGLIKQLAVRKFDASRQYLWPIPSTEVLTSGLTQNPNY